MKKLNFDTLEMYRTNLEADDEEKEPLKGGSQKNEGESCIDCCLNILKCVTCIRLCNRCFQFATSCCGDFCMD